MKAGKVILTITLFFFLCNSHPSFAKTYSSEEVKEGVNDVIQEIYKEVSKLENNFHPLRGFRRKAKVSSSTIEYKKKIGHPNDSYPSGMLLAEDSCLFRLRIQKISYERRPRHLKVICYHNLHLQAIIEISVKSKRLSEVLQEIVIDHLEELEELNKYDSIPEDY